MKTKIWIVLVTLGFISVSGLVISDDDYDDDYYANKKEWGKRIWRESRLDVAPVDNALYNEECGSCHFAYQPGLLPARSWKRIMGGLENHFDENAELEAVDRQKLTAYLTENAADVSNYKRSRRIANSLKSSEAPLRVSGIKYFRRKHNELPSRMVEANPEVRSFSNCQLCHTQAAKGSYNEHEVNVPGYGRWDD